MGLPLQPFQDGDTAPTVKDSLNNIVTEVNAHLADTVDPHGPTQTISTEVITPQVGYQGNITIDARATGYYADTTVSILNSGDSVANLDVEGSAEIHGNLTVDGSLFISEEIGFTEITLPDVDSSHSATIKVSGDLADDVLINISDPGTDTEMVLSDGAYTFSKKQTFTEIDTPLFGHQGNVGFQLTDPTDHKLTIYGDLEVTGEITGFQGSGGSPGGSDTYVQFNDGGSFGGDSGFIYNKTSHLVTATGFQTGSIVLNGLAGNVVSSTNVETAIENLDDSMTKQVNSGIVSWSGSGNYWSVTNGTPNVFNLLRGGTGKIKGKTITFADSQSINLTANDTSYVYINSSGVLSQTLLSAISTHAIFEALYTDNIMLFEVLDFGGSGNVFVTQEAHPYSYPTNVSLYEHDSIGPIVRGQDSNISVVTVGTGASQDNIRIKITAGKLMDHGLEEEWAATNPITINWMYQNGAGKWLRDSQGSLTPLKYNSSGTATALSAGNYGIYTIYVSKSSLNTADPQFFGVMNTAQYANLTAANAVISAGTFTMQSNELAALELARLGIIVVRNSGTYGYIGELVVSKSVVNSNFVSGGAATSHNLLSNLTSGDDHSQYAYLAGRQGGQTLVGGTLANEDLTLNSTSNGIKGDIIVADRVVAQNGINLTGSLVGDVENITAIFDGGGAAITVGAQGVKYIDKNYTIVGWTLVSDVSGSIKVDIWEDTYANYPPTDADSIAVGVEPSITSAVKNQDLAISGWQSTALTAGSVIVFNVDSCTSITKATLDLKVTTA